LLFWRGGVFGGHRWAVGAANKAQAAAHYKNPGPSLQRFLKNYLVIWFSKIVMNPDSCYKTFF
jgi:hypothetical protein